MWIEALVDFLELVLSPTVFSYPALLLSSTNRWKFGMIFLGHLSAEEALCGQALCFFGSAVIFNHHLCSILVSVRSITGASVAHSTSVCPIAGLPSFLPANWLARTTNMRGFLLSVL
jgi:hypothetical protein